MGDRDETDETITTSPLENAKQVFEEDKKSDNDKKFSLKNVSAAVVAMKV